VQAVQYWINRDKAAHAITDSVSHDVPMLGGMIGFIPRYFMDKTGARTWKQLIDKRNSYNWNAKGNDQSFLTDIVYPCFAQKGSDSITQHYFKGMSNSFLSDYKTCTCEPPAGHADHCINNTPIDLPFEYKESNSTCGHIGAAGFYTTALERFLSKYKDKFVDLQEIEQSRKDIFYWANDVIF
jgi:hypothetical protein